MTPSGGEALASVGNPLVVAPSNAHALGDDDQAVVARARAGDRDAFAALVSRHGDRLYRMLLHLAGGDGDAAAEYAQEAFARAFAHLHQFEGKSAFYTWLYRLARNRALDLMARKRPTARDLEPLGAIAPGATPLERLGADELRAAVRAALARLPAATRELILLRDFDGLDYARIAELLDVAEGTVKSRLNRARAALKAALDGKIVVEDLA